ncbi:MAG: hypothetical protein V1898_03380 [Patescibacteria group bacterium]
MQNDNLKFDAKDIEANKTIACLSYIGLLFIVPILTKKESKFAMAHAKQGLVLFIIDIIASMVFWFPIFGQLLFLAVILVSIYGVVQTLQGKYWQIPFIHEISKKFNF